METPILLSISLPEKVSANKIYAGRHWTKRQKEAHLYKEYLLPYRQTAPISEPVEITYIFTFKSKPLDSSNCFYMSKLLEDALVHNNVIADDDPAHVTATTVIPRKGDRDEVSIYIV